MQSIVVFLTCLLLVPVPTVAGGRAESGQPPILVKLHQQFTASLHKLDTDLAQTATRLSALGLTGSAARQLLLKLCADNPAVVDCATVDLAGRVVTLEPASFKQFEGVDISQQEQVWRLHRTKKPVLSNAIRAVEGFDAVDLEHPVFSPQGKFLGSVSMLIKPEALLPAVIAPAVQGLPVEAWVIQRDGRILYAPNPEMIGRNVFHDSLCGPAPQFHSLAREIAAKKSGSGIYHCRPQGLQTEVKKQAFWTTVDLHRTAWRLLVTHVMVGAPAMGEPRVSAVEVAAADAALRTLARDPELHQALAADDQDKALHILQRFYEANPGLYAVQWVDSTGINRFGYPAENSLTNYDFRARGTLGDQQFLDAMQARKETSFELPLIEGKLGRFFIVPIQTGDTYHGWLDTIRIKP